MKTPNIILILIFSLLSSCSKNIFDSNYKGENNYKNFYIVDTITIENPILTSYYGGRFVFSRQLLEKTKINSDFFKRPDVFLLGFDLYYDMNPRDYKRYNYQDDGNCKTKKVVSNQKHIEIYEYTNNPVRFILCLINVNYYNVKHNAENYYQICIKDQKNSFYKIVFPLCK